MKVNKGDLPFPGKPGKPKAPVYPFAEMELGDWLVVDDVDSAERVQNAGYSYGKKNGSGFRLSRRKHEGQYYLVRVK